MTTTRLAVLSAALGALTWGAWLSWGFYPDRVYPTWQVVACGATAVVLTIVLAVAGLPTRRWVSVAWPFTAGLAVAWTIWAMRDDDSGMALVGTMMLVIGAGLGTSFVESVTRAVAAFVRSRR